MPPVLVAVMLPVVGRHGTHGAVTGFWLGLLASLFAAAVPLGFVAYQVRLGRLTDHNVGRREQRAVPLLVGLVSVVISLVLLTSLEAPQELIALILAGAVGLLVTLVVSHWWKMSVHTGVASGCAVILILVFGPPAVVVWPLLVVVGWARVYLGDHTIAQALGGGVIGGLVAGTVFTVLR